MNRTDTIMPALKRAICLLVALLVLASSGDAMAKKKRRVKRKAKRPVATAPAKTPTEPPSQPVTEPARSATDASAPAAEPTNTEAAAVGAPAESLPGPEAVAPGTDSATEAASEAGPPTVVEQTQQATVVVPVVAEPSEPFAADPAPAPRDSDWHFRAGVNGGIMYFMPGPSYGLNVSGRFGVRLNDLLSTYADAGTGFGLGGGGSFSEGGTNVSVSAAAYWRVGALAELDLGPFFVAAGPALFKGTWAEVTQAGDSTGATQEMRTIDGYYPAALGRLGFSFGSRSKFTLALEAMAVFGKVTEVKQSAGSGGATQSASIGKSAMAVSPTLVLGWDI